MHLPAVTRLKPGRETRLLLLTIAVSVAMLLLLARFRFPAEVDSDAAAAATMQPLQRLAARATYDELASIIAQLEGRLAPGLAVLRVSSRDPFDQSLVVDFSRPAQLRSSFPRYIPAIRVRRDAVLALVQPGTEVRAVVGQGEGVPMTLARDPVRGLQLVRVPSNSEAYSRFERADVLRPPTYVALVEATRGGPTVRPVFLGRTDPMSDPKWNRALLVPGGTLAAEPGSLVFSLDGRFVGLSVLEEGTLAVAPADTLLEIVDQLERGEMAPSGDLGVQLQPLTPALASATGAEHGPVVSYVSPRGPAAGRLEVGDAIEALDGRPVFSTEGLAMRIAGLEPGTAITLQVKRRRSPLDVELVVAPLSVDDIFDRRHELGLVLRAVPGIGTEVMRVARGTAGAYAGLAPADIITGINGREAPTPAQLSRTFAAAPSDSVLILKVERDARHFVLALEKP